MGALISDIIEEAQSFIGEVAGAGVQTYSDDRMLKDCVRSFNMLFKKYHWHQFREWYRLELDGTTGLVTTDDLTNVRDFDDFHAVMRDAEQGSMPIMPRGLNPYAMPTGAKALYWTSLSSRHASFATKRLQIYPVTATGFLNIGARTYPLDATESWVPTDEMDLDRNMLVYGTAFMTLSSDDINPGAADVAKNMMEMHYRDIISGFAGLPQGGSASGIPTDWRVA